MGYSDFRAMTEREVPRTTDRSEGGERRAESGHLLRLQRLRREENAMLAAAGFELVEGDLWRKDGCWFGREAALQRLRN